MYFFQNFISVSDVGRTLWKMHTTFVQSIMYNPGLWNEGTEAKKESPKVSCSTKTCLTLNWLGAPMAAKSTLTLWKNAPGGFIPCRICQHWMIVEAFSCSKFASFMAHPWNRTHKSLMKQGVLFLKLSYKQENTTDDYSHTSYLRPFAQCRLPNLPFVFLFTRPCLGRSCNSITCIVLCLFAVPNKTDDNSPSGLHIHVHAFLDCCNLLVRLLIFHCALEWSKAKMLA